MKYTTIIMVLNILFLSILFLSMLISSDIMPDSELINYIQDDTEYSPSFGDNEVTSHKYIFKSL